MSARIVALSGGVGGAKLASGLASVLEDDELAVIANTGDDFDHLGLQICPDIDTLMYTLAGRNNPETGWGRRDETWSFMHTLKELKPDSWFSLGDHDLAVHVWRTWQLNQGRTLSQVTGELARAMKVATAVIPMSDDPVRTTLDTNEGVLEFQDYFVRQKCQPTVQEISFTGADQATPAPAFASLLTDNSVDAFVVCPSNPYLSVNPILSLPGVSEALRRHSAPVIVVSPIVGGNSLKGPTAKIMGEMNIPCDLDAIADHYGNLADILVIDSTDAEQQEKIATNGIEVAVANIVMGDETDRRTLAEFVLGLVESAAV